MTTIDEIIFAIDQFLEDHNLQATTPVEVSPYLEKKGILRDSASRPGLPLRKKLREGKIKHAYQNGSRWIIPHSKSELKKTLAPRKKPAPHIQPSIHEKTSISNHKLTSVAQTVCAYLQEKYHKKPEYFLEYRPEWLLTYPDYHLLNFRPEIIHLYSRLVGKTADLLKALQKLPVRKLKQKQSYDIWIGAPYNFAVEFDEKQHFNQYRNITLNYYNKLPVNYPLSLYKELNQSALIRPGTSGFTKLKSSDPLFPEIFPGAAQDNRIRQRAFRDYLKDVLPLANNMNPTLRIPYHITGKKINDFGQNELDSIKGYLEAIDLKI